MRGEEIIYQAMENLEQETGFVGFFHAGNHLDGELKLNLDGREQEFTVEIKRELRTHQLDQILTYYHQYPNFLLVAEKLFPRIKQRLRQLKVPYLEANGDFYLPKDGLYVMIETGKTIKKTKETGNRAFTKTGLKVLFHFLVDRQLVNETQRTIAKRTGVALGNVPQVIAGLQDTGYLLTLRKKEYVWENRNELLNRWVTEYGTQLKPTLLKGRYRLREGWQHINLDVEDTQWGGEPAADLLTNHLRPEIFTLYTKLTTQLLLRQYPLMPDKQGDVHVYQTFWEDVDQHNGHYEKTVHPLLVYADLMIADNKRCRETAELIFDEYLKQII